MSEQAIALPHSESPGNGVVPSGGKQERNWRALERERNEWRARAERAERRIAELEDAYQRGRADLQAEIEFAERLSAVRARYPDFDAAWSSVRPLVPRSVWEEMADHPDGLDSAYHLSKLPELCQELSELEPAKARERFRHFVKDLVALTRGTR